jgi:hypothetical protein
MCPENLKRPREVPAGLAGRMQALYESTQSVEAMMAAALGGTVAIKMTWGVGAEQVWIDLAKKLGEEPDAQRRELFCRVAEITERVASVIAFGRFARVVEREDVLLARAIVLQSAEILFAGVREYAEEELSLNALCKKIVEWLKAAGGVMTRRDLMRKARPLIAKGGDVSAAIAYLIDSGELQVVKDLTRGRPSDVMTLV